MTEKKVYTKNKHSEKLIGIKTTPTIQKNKYPAVILVQWFWVEKNEWWMFTEIAKRLSNEWIMVFRFDISWCFESEWNFDDTSLSKQKDDLYQILFFVQSLENVDTSRIWILWQSFWTITTIALEPKVKCLIMMWSVSHPKTIISTLLWENYNPDWVSKIIAKSGRIINILPHFWKDLDNYNLLESIKNIQSPVLFIHWSNDYRVPVSEMEDYFLNANNPKEKLIIRWANHWLLPHRDIMYEKVVEWFNKFLY